MKIKYFLDIALFNLITDENRYIEEIFDDQYEAAIKRDEILDNLSDDWLCCWNKIFPLVPCCGGEVSCFEFTNTCDICGTEYNHNGQRLTPREEWGWETGENF